MLSVAARYAHMRLPLQSPTEAGHCIVKFSNETLDNLFDGPNIFDLHDTLSRGPDVFPPLGIAGVIGIGLLAG